MATIKGRVRVRASDCAMAIEVQDELEGRVNDRGLKALDRILRTESIPIRRESWSPRPDTGSWPAADVEQSFPRP